MHALMDQLSVQVASVFFKRIFFTKGIESPDYREHLQNIQLKIPEIKGEGIYEVEAQTLSGKLDPAFHIVQWKGNEYPTIIYHHGNNERPFKYGAFDKNTFHSILGKNKEEINANLINIRAPYHQSLKTYMNEMGELANFIALLTTSLKLINELVVYCRQLGSNKIIITGPSLGGWVTNLHRAYYNNAEIYIPIMAGAVLEDVFINSIYQKLTGERALKSPEKIKKALNFEKDFSMAVDDNVFPILALRDQIIRYEVQKKSYGKHQVRSMDKGHATGIMNNKFLRQEIVKHLN